jgi:hypothetical protein
MNTITQEELESMKIRYDRRNICIGMMDAFIEDVFEDFPALIAAAEEGLKVREAISGGRSCGEMSCDECNDRTSSLRARVQELEEALKNLLVVSENADETGYVDGEGWLPLEEIQEQARAVLSNSTSQPPRYTLEEVLADFQATHDALDRENAPTVKTSYGLAIAHLKQMITDSLPPAPQQKEGA